MGPTKCKLVLGQVFYLALMIFVCTIAHTMPVPYTKEQADLRSAAWDFGEGGMTRQALIEKIVPSLNSGDFETRNEAARMLGKLRAVEALKAIWDAKNVNKEYALGPIYFAEAYVKGEILKYLQRTTICCYPAMDTASGTLPLIIREGLTEVLPLFEPIAEGKPVDCGDKRPVAVPKDYDVKRAQEIVETLRLFLEKGRAAGLRELLIRGKQKGLDKAATWDSLLWIVVGLGTCNEPEAKEILLQELSWIENYPNPSVQQCIYYHHVLYSLKRQGTDLVAQGKHKRSLYDFLNDPLYRVDPLDWITLKDVPKEAVLKERQGNREAQEQTKPTRVTDAAASEAASWQEANENLGAYRQGYRDSGR